MGKTVNDIHLRGLRSAQPAASSSNKGFIYCVTDEDGILERSNGSSWESFSPAAPAAGTVTKTGSPASGNLAKFSGSTTITNADLTGDVTTSGGVATTIANDAVTYAKMQNVSATDRLLGRDTAGSGDTEELTVGGGVEFTGSGGIQRSALTGDVTASAGSASTTIANSAVTTAKINDGAVTEAKQTLADNTTNDVSTTKHGYAPKAPNDATKFLDGTAAYDTVKDSDLSTSDITTNDVTTSKHGFVPKAPNSTSKYLRGDGTWANLTGPTGGYNPSQLGLPPALAGWTQVNYGGSASDEDGGFIYLQCPDPGADDTNNIRILAYSLPGSTFDLKTTFRPVWPEYQGHAYESSIGLRESGSGKLVLFTFLVSGGVFYVQANRYTNPTTYSGAGPVNTNSGFVFHGNVALRIQQTGGTRYYFWSNDDGAHWQSLASESGTAFITPDQAVIAVNSQRNTKVVGIALNGWSLT